MKKIILSFLLLGIVIMSEGQSITIDPNTTTSAGVQVNSDLAFRKQKRETANGGWPNYPRDNSSVIIFEGGGTLSGIADGQEGLLLYVFNGYPTAATATGQLTIQHENASSVAANRIMTPNGADFLVGNGGLALIYDGTKQRWRVATPAQTGGGGSFAGWGLTGNGGTNPSTVFIGTTDSKDLVFKTNNEERVRIDDANPHFKITGLVDNPVYGQVLQNYQKIPLIYSQRHGGTISNPTSLFGQTPLLYFDGMAHDGTDIKTYARMGFITDPNFGTNNVLKGGRIGFATRKDKTSDLEERLSIASDGEVSIKGDVSWGKGRLNIDGTIAFSKGDYIFSTSDNSLAIFPHSSVYKISGGLTYELKWIWEDTELPKDGQLMYIYVLSSTSVNIHHNYNVQGGSRIITNTGSTISISDGGGVTLIYDKDSNYWRVIGIAQ